MGGASARDLIVRGRVQGVFFRAFVEDEARRAGVSGWAENRPDGSVAVRLEGPPEAVAEVERACGRGPRSAEVSEVEATNAPVEGLEGFVTR